MASLVICIKCAGHRFIVVTGSWQVGGKDQIEMPLTLLCVGCGAQGTTATWTAEGWRPYDPDAP